MKPPIVLDTNVAVVANGRASQAGPNCVLGCIDGLEAAQARCRILVDDQGLILGEYWRQLSPSGQPGPGDAFFKWLWANQANPAHCSRVAVTLTQDERCFREFPLDPDLDGFDRADRVFVATVIASGESPPVLNASDTDWWLFRDALEKHGVRVCFLCPELMHEHG